MGMLWNTSGLVLGMAGVLLIFFWGPPQPSFEEHDVIWGSGIDLEAIARKKRHKLISGAGLALIFLGFLAQLVASWSH